MILKLLESRRARRFAGLALFASVAVHAATIGAAARPAPARPAGEEGGLISLRYLLPPDRVQAPVGERIRFIAIGPGTSGWAAGNDPAATAGEPVVGSRQPAQATREPESVDDGEKTEPTTLFTEDQVDSAATRDPASAGPSYPDELREKGVQGEVLVEFAVDTTGRADPGSFTVVMTTHPLFADAVRDALPGMLFTPALAHGRRVRQLVRLPMKFKLLVEAKGAT
jgi:TonB family protein